VSLGLTPSRAAKFCQQDRWTLPTSFRAGNTLLGNMTGLPALVLPCGLSGGPPPLPIGLQIYGRAFDEATVLRVGHAYEQATGWHREKPAL
jgi:Asp-tRNA(Asn)/Glu-tRNA(Gln) amidotransferase A subunit family amidase